MRSCQSLTAHVGGGHVRLPRRKGRGQGREREGAIRMRQPWRRLLSPPHAIGPQARRPPAILVAVVPLVLQIRQHLAGEQVDVGLAQLARHRAEMQQRQQMAHAQRLDAVEQLLAHGLRAADHHIAALVEVLRFQIVRIDLGARIVMQRLPARRIRGSRGSPGSTAACRAACERNTRHAGRKGPRPRRRCRRRRSAAGSSGGTDCRRGLSAPPSPSSDRSPSWRS